MASPKVDAPAFPACLPCPPQGSIVHLPEKHHIATRMGV
jgi:hypothetical protein